jgi:hypothetical protein
MPVQLPKKKNNKKGFTLIILVATRPAANMQTGRDFLFCFVGCLVALAFKKDSSSNEICKKLHRGPYYQQSLEEYHVHSDIHCSFILSLKTGKVQLLEDRNSFTSLLLMWSELAHFMQGTSYRAIINWH